MFFLTKIDLTHAYWQMSLEVSFRELVTVNTHQGLYRYTQLPFGFASPPANTVLQGLSKVMCYIDDILITPVLAHYDPALPMKIAEDASAYGIGAVISIAFAFRTLSTLECNYAYVQREALMGCLDCLLAISSLLQPAAPSALTKS